MSPSDSPDAAQEWERISRLLAENASGYLTGDELVDMPKAEIEWTEWQ